MTTIAYRGGVLAADTGVTVNGSKMGTLVKVWRRPDDGALAGAAGSAGFSAAFRKWFLTPEKERGKPPEPINDDRIFDRGVVFHADGRIEVHEAGGSFDVSTTYYAFGNGSDVALGAMFAGADAPTAVAAAIEHNPYTFGEITVLTHSGVAPGARPNGLGTTHHDGDAAPAPAL